MRPESLVLKAFASGRGDVGLVFEAALRGWPGHDGKGSGAQPQEADQQLRLHFLAEIQNPWYNNRHRPGRAWRHAEHAIAARTRLYTTRDKETGIFLFESAVTH
jgi:hypothetical protein